MRPQAVPGVHSTKLSAREAEYLQKKEATEARLLTKFGPGCFAFADLMDDLDRTGTTDFVLNPAWDLLNQGDLS